MRAQLIRNKRTYMMEIALTLSLYLASIVGCKSSTETAGGLKKINHVIVFYMENHSFDNLYGEFAGADGLSGASATQTQVDSSGKAYTTLPPLPASSDPKGVFPANLPNKPFNIDQYASEDVLIPDLVHRYYQEQQQIDGGKMDKFAFVSNSKCLSMGYYHTSELPMTTEAKKYVLCDHFYHSAFGGSFLNHIYFIAAAAPVFPGAPSSIVAQVDANGNLIKDGQVTPDGYVVNTSYTVNTPHPSFAAANTLVPNQTMPTIGDRLSAANVSWVWYSGGWNDALAGHPDSLFQFHHQPFAFFANYADGTAAKATHLKDEADFIAAAKAGTLPAVSFIKPLGEENEHPGYADIATGERHLEELINDVRNGPNWNDCVIIVTYDEHGGFWDHVPPPTIDKWGPGIRVPGILISPFAKTGFVDNAQYETVSILSLIEHRWNLQPLGTRDANANYFLNSFNF